MRLAFPVKDPSDVVDANLNDEARSSRYKGQLGVTTEQAPNGTFSRSCKNATREDQFRYDMNRPERGCFIIFNQEVRAFCLCNLLLY